MIILQNTCTIYKGLYKYKIYQRFTYQITMLNKHIDAQKTVTLSFRKKKKVQILFDLHLLCGETGSRTYTFTEYHKTAND